MVLSAIRSNVHNVEPTMLPDDVVTTLGLRALGNLEETLWKDGTDYQFVGQRSRLIVQTVLAPIPDEIAAINGLTHPFDNQK